MTERESDFTKLVINLGRLYGFRVAHFRPARVVRNGREKYETPVAGDGKGWPDLVLVSAKKRRIIYAELKCGRNKLTPEQREWRDALVAAGAEFHEWRPEDWDSIQAILRGQS